MQGKLTEIDIRSILQLIEAGQRTGELLVTVDVPSASFRAKPEVSTSSDLTATFKPERAWFVFFLNGHIVYATQGNSGLSRLKDYLRRYQVEAVAARYIDESEEQHVGEYDCLWFLLRNHVLTPSQSCSIVHSMVHEVLFDLLSLYQGNFVFATGSALSPQLTTLDVTPHLIRTMRQLQQWKQLSPYIQSPEQCPAIADTSRLQLLLSNRTFNKLSGFIDEKTSIRQIARYLNRDIPTVAKAMYPHIQQEVIRLLQPALKENNSTPRSKEISPVQLPMAPISHHASTIVCVDDEAGIGELMQSALSPHGYAVTAIANPLDAFSLIFQIKPDLVFCSFTFSNLDGCEICAMLRQATAFRQTPIVMLSNKDKLIDRVRARIAGATDYLTKPFGENEILTIVEKYIDPDDSKLSPSVAWLTNSSDDRLQSDRTEASSISSTPLN